MTVLDRVSPEAQAARIAEFRGICVDALRSVQPVRQLLLSRGSLDDAKDLERAFNAVAAVGRFNREQPAYAISADEIALALPVAA